MNNKDIVDSAFLMLINAEVAEYVDDLPCKAEVMRSQTILTLFELLEPDLSVEQLAQIDRLRRYHENLVQ